MSDVADQTTKRPTGREGMRYTKRVQILPDGRMCITVGGIEFGMSKAEALRLAVMIEDVHDGLTDDDYSGAEDEQHAS